MSFSPIAIVGRACLLPGASSPEELWEAISSGKDLLGTTPTDRWRASDKDLLCAPDEDSANRSWSNKGGYVSDFARQWDPAGYAIPSSELDPLDPSMLWTLHCARQTLADAGDLRTGAVDRSRVSAVFGNLGFPSAGMSKFAESIWLQEEAPGAPQNRFMSGGCAALLERALGLAPGVMCLDTACASSLYAIAIACDQLHDGEADLALAGGVSCSDDLFIHVGFTALNAMSRTGQSRPFHPQADGLVPAEGAAFVALKRLSDARRDGDRIYGVIRGIGLSNDGRGRGFLAPDIDGQKRAMQNAYQRAGITPRDVSLLECHATGTSVGDETEIRSTAAVFSDCHNVPIGSLKSNMGHLITAAGAAGLIKVLMALQHKQRPPTLHTGLGHPALQNSPFRLLQDTEDWDSPGPRIAGISAFGFGGNNAHLLVSEDHESIQNPTLPVIPPSPIAIVAVGTIVGDTTGRSEFTRALLEGSSLLQPGKDGSLEARSRSLSIELAGLKFPPNDLQDALPQQLTLLATAREAIEQVTHLPSETTGVFIGMEPDPEVCRYGLRWRQAQRLRDAGKQPADHTEWLQRTGDEIIPTLNAAGVVGAMPNIPANRINSQLNLGGASYSISCGPDSGTRSLLLAIRALRAKHLDAALVGAVDLSCHEVHRAAATMLHGGIQQPGDAAVSLILKRLEDALDDGDAIVSVIENAPESTATATVVPNLNHLLGESWAAGSLRDITAAAVCLSHRASTNGHPLLNEPAESQAVRFHPSHLMRPHSPPAQVHRVPRLHVFAAANRKALLQNWDVASESTDGPCRLVIVADGPEQLKKRRTQARRQLENQAPLPQGVFFQDAPIDGALALVFAGAGAAYPQMGREWLQAMPALGERLLQRSKRAAETLLTPWAANQQTPPLQRLWSSSALCQLHALLSLDHLKLKPDAVLGYSSGESNALFATGIWNDMDRMVEDAQASLLFTKDLGGSLEVVEKAWGEATGWETWTVLAPVDRVKQLVDQTEQVFLAVIHTDEDCIIAGAPKACASIVKAIGRARCLRLHYDLAVHVPLLNEVADQWLALHRRPVTAQDLDVYSAGTEKPFSPTTERCARAILGQANQTLDFRRAVETAYANGVRIFVEHGPQGNCARWIREILGDRPAVVVSLDRKGRPLEALIETIAALLAASVDFEHEELMDTLNTPAHQPSPTLNFETHREPIHGIPLPAPAGQHMPAAPALPSVHPPDATKPRTQTLAEVPTPIIVPPVSEPARPASRHSAHAAAPIQAAQHDPAVEAIRSQIALMGDAEQQYIQQQTALHQHFIALQERAMQVLWNAKDGLHTPAKTIAQLPAPAPAPRVEVPPPLQNPEVPAPTTAPAPQVAKAPTLSAVPPLPTPTPVKPDALRSPIGPTFDFDQLKTHASGKISEIFGSDFQIQDDYVRQVRMPEPPLLLADRITGLDAEMGVIGKGTIWSESDVETERWFMHQGHMPASIMIESGQADLMLISYMGVDFTNRGERVYRLLGCELTYHGGLPSDGDTLKYDIHMDNHATQGDIRLMFFHYDCRIDGEVRLSVRKGQAGFFTDQELAESDGCLWTPESQEITDSPRLDTPPFPATPTHYSIEEVQAFANGHPWRCFGSALALTQTHTRTPRIQNGPMMLLGAVSDLDRTGGPWGRGYAQSTVHLNPDLWFFEGHFKNDPCMPGTLMFEGCLQLMAFYLASQGYTVQRDGWRFEPVSGQPFQLSCRGQVTPSSQTLTYELFVEEIFVDGQPTLYADLLCTVDGLKAFHARRVGLKLVPAWPLDEGSKLLTNYEEPKPVAQAGEFPFDYRSLIACANGRPSEAFGSIYERFDGIGRVARLPNPPYHFLSRVTRTQGEIGSMQEHMEVDVEYDIPADAWYFDENGCRAMPFAVLLEAALQPCGWLASYMGCALTTDIELCFRNLDGTGKLLVDLLPDSGTLLTQVRSTSISRTASMIIVSFDVLCSVDGLPVYEMDTVFGFFPQEALENQVGLSTSNQQRAALETPDTCAIDLRKRPAPYWDQGRPHLAEPMLLMLDRITQFNPTGGAAGLGSARGEKDVNPGEWFFKAHFFQDPVQPGSLGIEALIQLLQWTMLENNLDEGIANPRFETLGLGEAMTWKYRGQVVPTNQVISSTLEITAIERTPEAVLVTADASLWVDGKRIYETSNLGMRIVSGGTPQAPRTILDPNKDGWIQDHCPTFTVPALPMMSMVDLLAQGACFAEPVISLEDVTVKGWLTVATPQTLFTERAGNAIQLFAENEDGSVTEVAAATVRTGTYPDPPAPLAPLKGDVSPLPYETGTLFHGPAFQLLQTLIQTSVGSTATLTVNGGVPVGRLNPGLLDGATHGIPHDQLTQWDPRLDAEKVAYPALISKMTFYGPTPTEGEARVEVRPDGYLGTPDFPAFQIQIIHNGQVWCALRLIESCFPKGPFGSVNPQDRMAFLRDSTFVSGVQLSETEGETTTLLQATVDSVDWLPGTVASLYGTSQLEEIAHKEHIAHAHQLHPQHVPEALPLHSFALQTERFNEGIRVQGDPRGQLNIAPVQRFWSRWFNVGRWPVEDLYYGLIERFLGRVVLEDPTGFEGLRGQSVLYLANHQVGIESLLFSIIASALNEVPTVTLAKAEHRNSWLGKLIAQCFEFPDVTDPRVIAFFDRKDKASLPRILQSLAKEMTGPGRSVMVHVEGTRSLDCTTPVQKMSGAFLDMALELGVPVVPVRFVGGLSRTPLEARSEFPVGMGRQDIYFGTPIYPEDLKPLHYGERKSRVIHAINALGPCNSEEQPAPASPEFAQRVHRWSEQTGVSVENAVLREVLAETQDPGEQVAQLLREDWDANLGSDPLDSWLRALGHRLHG